LHSLRAAEARAVGRHGRSRLARGNLTIFHRKEKIDYGKHDLLPYRKYERVVV
jgi:hypothetical protein